MYDKWKKWCIDKKINTFGWNSCDSPVGAVKDGKK
jgi:hypothetical protein